MRVLINTGPLLSKKTGVGYYISNIYRELLNCGIDVEPTIGDGSRVFVKSLMKITAALRTVLGKGYLPLSFTKYIGDTLIKRLADRDDNLFDIYHETSLDPMPETNSRIVSNLYDLSFIYYPAMLPEAIANVAKPNVIRNLSVSDRIIVNSEFIKNEAIDFFKIPEERIDVIALAPSAGYYAIDGAASKPAEVAKLTEKDYILYVGTVEPRKNLKTLIRAFKDVRERYDLSLVIAGGLGWKYDDIISYPGEIGIGQDVIFSTYVDEKTLLYLYNYASIFVYPSVYEGFGLPPLEAMSCGAPVIISDIPVLTEIAGDAALTFSVTKYEDLAYRIAEVLNSDSLRSSLRKKGLARAAEFSWRKAAEETIETYKKALKN